MDRYDEDCDGTISYAEFVKGVFRPGVGATDPRKREGKDPNSTRGLVERVRATILAKTGAGNGLRSAAAALKRFDGDGSGTLDVGELVRGLATLGLTGIDPPDAARLMAAFDKDGSGKISVDEFYKGLQGRMPRRRKLIVRKAYDLLDRDGSGLVTVEDVAGAYDVTQHPDVAAGKITEREALQDILATYDQAGEDGKRDGVVTFSEFLEYYKDLSCMMESDEHFELMVRNAWHISGGEGNAKNTSCRRVKVLHGDGTEKIYEVENDLGIGPKDLDLMRVRLVAQGVEDIKEISIK